MSKIQQADELINDLEEKAKNMDDLKAALDFEKEKRMKSEQMYQRYFRILFSCLTNLTVVHEISTFDFLCSHLQPISLYYFL